MRNDSAPPSPPPSDEFAIDRDSCDDSAEVEERVPSRQREWQKRMQAEGRCIICGDEAVVSCYCETHRARRRKKINEARRRKPQQQTCSFCGEGGHNQRTCPKAKSLKSASEKPPENKTT